MEELTKYSDPMEAQRRAYKVYGPHARLYYSSRPTKKYMILDPTGKRVHFGQMKYEDFTLHKDEKRRQHYLSRALKLRGNWRKNLYSPNQLAMRILWNLDD